MAGEQLAELVVVDFWASTFAGRVRIALREKGLQFDTREEHQFKSGHKTPLLLEMNPVHKKVPVLIHNGKPLCESLIIVEYIDETWTHQAPLLPSDPYDRAQARFWANFVDQKINTAVKSVRGASTGEDLEGAKKELIQCLKVLEQELGDKKYFMGESFGFVDIALIPFTSWFYTVEMKAKLSMEELFPKLVQWCKRCCLRDTVSQSIPDQHKVYEFYLELQKNQQY